MPTVTAVPHGRTARRLAWEFLPRHVRSLVEEHLGAAVVGAESCDAGFTPGFASVLTGANGATQFVKAANRKAQRAFATAYAEEGRKLALLGAGGVPIPAPRLLWRHDDDWVVLGFEAFPGRPPERPWTPAQLDRALDAVEEMARAMDPVPASLGLVPLVEDIPELVTSWSALAASGAERPHLEDVDGLARSFAELPDRAFCHSDLRDDNVLLGADGGAAICDWNWPALGPAWLDTVDLLVSARGDGLDTDARLAGRSLTRDVDPDDIDAWLAALCGYMTVSQYRPVPSSSPYLRVHAAWYAEVLWEWLCDRRGWR